MDFIVQGGSTIGHSLKILEVVPPDRLSTGCTMLLVGCDFNAWTKINRSFFEGVSLLLSVFAPLSSVAAYRG